MLFPCNRRLEEAVRACPRRPENILELGKAFLNDITVAACEAFVKSFLTQSALPLSENCSQYVRFCEDWWRRENAPFPNEW